MRAFLIRYLRKPNLNFIRRHVQESFDKIDIAGADEAKFEKILIANRGEIACRIMKTCRSLGIKTVAIYSETDRNELHVQLADEAMCIGPSLTQSYLEIESIIQASEKSGAEAVHPGYGFLSENTRFAEKLAAEKISFIGPNTRAVRAMGDKINSKKVASLANVSMIPGLDEEIKDELHCIRVARELGYPVMIKASAGGGGKGLRIAWNEKQALSGYKLAKEEALASFGDDRILIEKYIENARHIEMQILCDKYGNSVWLNERECSIQRRNQKVIEEAPSHFLDDFTRRKMGEQACALAAAVGYDSAGTVEFLVDSNRNFYFLEMNTRLQVEHPVTEAITGIDLVHQMMRIAYGHKLNVRQSDIRINGHSIECRVCAEDPYRDFGLPAVGRITKYEEPVDITGIRFDSGVQEGTNISLFYDPLMCKIISHGSSRSEALHLLRESLDKFVVRGVTNNICLLRDVLNEEHFINGEFSTNYFTQTYPTGFKGPKINQREFINLAALAAHIFAHYERRAMFPSRDNSGLTCTPRETLLSIEIPYTTEDLILHFTALVSLSKDNKMIIVNGSPITIEGLIDFSLPVFDLKINNERMIAQVDCFIMIPMIETQSEFTYLLKLICKEPAGYLTVQYKGYPFRMKILTTMAKQLEQYMLPKKELHLKNAIVSSPMPGLITSVAVEIGQFVVKGQEVCVMEAMKMRNSLTADCDGKVMKIHCRPGDTIDADKVLIEFEGSPLF